MVFERLGLSLYDFLRKNAYRRAALLPNPFNQMPRGVSD